MSLILFTDATLKTISDQSTDHHIVLRWPLSNTYFAKLQQSWQGGVHENGQWTIFDGIFCKSYGMSEEMENYIRHLFIADIHSE